MKDNNDRLRIRRDRKREERERERIEDFFRKCRRDIFEAIKRKGN